MEFKLIDIGEIKQYMDVAFCGDNDLINKYHFSDKTIEETVINNIKNVEELSESKPIACYGILVEDTPVGFTVFSTDLLYSFGINIHCRSKEIVLEWFDWVKVYLNNKFVVCLHSENTRARDFFLRNGLEVFIEDDGENICLIN